MNFRQVFFLPLVLSASVMALAQARPQSKPATPAPATPAPTAGAKQKPPTKDEVYFSIGRRINAQNNAVVSGVVAALDGVIEVKDITVGADGKAIVTVQERTPSNASYTQRAIRLMLAPAGDDKWTFEQFEESRRFYAAEKIFSYTTNDLLKKKQNITAKLAGFNAALLKQVEAGIKAMETAKAVLKSDPPVLSSLVTSRTALIEALKNNEQDTVINIFYEVNGNTDALTGLADSNDTLKANDAYLRLIEEFKASLNTATALRRDYVEAVKVYNESLVRLPFALVAYGLEFQRIEPKLEAPAQ